VILNVRKNVVGYLRYFRTSVNLEGPGLEASH